MGATLLNPHRFGVLVSDTFTRADGPLGNAETGQPWVVTGGATYVVASNKATKTSGTAHNQANIDLGKTDHFVAADIFGATGAIYGGLVVRFVSAIAHYLLQVQMGGAATLYRVTGGYLVIGTHTPVGGAVSGDRWRLGIVGSAIAVHRNGALVLTVADSTHSVGTAAGLNSYSGASAIQYDNVMMG